MKRQNINLILVLIMLLAVVFCLASCSFKLDLNGGLSNVIDGIKDNVQDDTDGDVNIPNDPSNPDDDINTPSEPNTPVEPEEPSEPEEPDTPSEPEEPDTPSEPSEPSEPEEPDTPTEPETPTEPDVPSEPDVPQVTTKQTVSMTAYEMVVYVDGDSLEGTVMSGETIMLDSNIGVEFSKGSANNEPAYYQEAVRIYQKGGIMTISALNGSVLESVTITFSDSKSGGSALQVSGGTVQKSGSTLVITANSNATSIVLTCAGTDKNGRLYVADLSVSYLGEPGTPVEPDTPTEPDTPVEPDTPEGSYTYTAFTSAQKTSILNKTGVNIPFFSTNDLYFEEYDEDGYSGVYISFECDSESRFQSYLDTLDSLYIFDETWTDDYGDTCYGYSYGDALIDVCYYEADDGNHYLDVDVYVENGSSGGGGSESGGSSNENIITNAGAGLPDDADGVYDVDFTLATNVKDVTDQGYYLDGCPTTGSPKVLVIPVEFSDVTATSKGYSIDNIKSAFYKDGECDYYSVYDYYYTASHGALELDITVLDSWFRPSNTSSYYASQTMEYYGDQVMIGDQLIMDEALAYLESTMDLSAFDSDGNETIDAVVLISTLEIDSNTDFYWAYRYWNIYTDENEYYYEYDGVSANDYLWAPYQFLFESSDGSSFDDEDAMNTYTFIHEFGHVLGADDYYDTAGKNEPLGGYDVMDYMSGDHNPYTKFNYGWVIDSRLIVTDTSVTITLEDYTAHGDSVIIANNWSDDLGAYQEYYVIAYYTNNSLNAGVGGYFEEEGIVVYHVNASLCKEEMDDEVYYNVYNNNTHSSDEYGTEDNLIEYVTHGGEYIYGVGDSLGSVTTDQGTTLAYTFTVDALTDTTATLTFTKK